MSHLSKALIAAGGNSLAAGDIPEAVSFDGSTDYLSRSSDLTGNTDSKTFTFSCWVYYAGDSAQKLLNFGTNQVRIEYDSFNRFYFEGRNASATPICQCFTANDTVPLFTWNHLLISIDLTNTSNRHLFINDVELAPTWSAYVNDNIDFTNTQHVIGAYFTFTDKLFGRLAHLYLDYTYRDLSVEANRRLFITEDLKPADGQASLNPILYLPMKDAETAHINEGTGGNFVQNGTLDTAQRGPNQWNCVASEFDGSADYLSKGSALSGAADNTKITLHFNYKHTTTQNIYFYNSISTAIKMRFEIRPSGVTDILVQRDAGGIWIQASIPSFATTGQNAIFTFSADVSDTNKRHLFVNGVDITSDVTWTQYNNGDIQWSTISTYYINRSASLYGRGVYGEFYLDNDYIDLSTDNPFWDSDANRPKPVRQVLEETGNTPLIAMPIEAGNEGLNLGTGGPFTVNSGPFVGARGASEFWARSAGLTPGVSSNLTQVSTMPITENAGFLSFWVNRYTNNSISRPYIFLMNGFLQIDCQVSTDDINYQVGANTGRVITDGLSVADGWTHFVFITGSTTQVYRNGILVSNTISSLLRTNNYALSIGYLTSSLDMDVAEVYFINQNNLIDFSDESNRNLFVDQLGYPKDLSKQIEDGLIPTPLIYMPFDDPDDLGKNLGTGGDFTVNGTVTAGADVDPNA